MTAEEATTRLLAFVEGRGALVGVSRDLRGDWGVSLKWGADYQHDALGLGKSYEAAIGEALAQTGAA